MSIKESDFNININKDLKELIKIANKNNVDAEKSTIQIHLWADKDYEINIITDDIRTKHLSRTFRYHKRKNVFMVRLWQDLCAHTFKTISKKNLR